MQVWIDESVLALLAEVCWMGLGELRCLMRVMCDSQTMPPANQSSCSARNALAISKVMVNLNGPFAVLWPMSGVLLIWPLMLLMSMRAMAVYTALGGGETVLSTMLVISVSRGRTRLVSLDALRGAAVYRWGWC